ncbi:hypothetical protein PR202_gb25760 [Eleusine coracana subsp. coracana]|uniref:Uncharacterized protein n=1 Tax=Eleusine coracana subsp. coracana TaxID=191504 RepID=A0AAV5FQ43_ELECO|nr:hypothetical protein PR202_gb25760 [Eleusine coracana subsp. coracana]
MVSTRRSARSSGSGSVPLEGEPAEPASGAALATVSGRRSREDSPPQRPGPAREIGSFHTAVVIHDKTLKQPKEVEKQGRKGNENAVVEGLDEMDEDDETLEEPPGWLPDGWIMEAHCDDNGTIYRRSHTWLPCGWVIEIRAGGKTMEKMYKDQDAVLYKD